MKLASEPTRKGTTMPHDNPLIGTWRLVSWENRSVADAGVSHPLGRDAVGYIMYGRDGYMSVVISRPDRARFAAEDLLGGGTGERARAAETYVSYCGTYEFRGETVVHFVELSLFPNWVGAEQERLVEVAGDRLVLSTRPILLGGVQRTAHLIWERVRTSER
jgi:Lipocalin-like domain